MVTENGRGTSCATLNAGDWNEGNQVVDRDTLSSRLSALETYLAELRALDDPHAFASRMARMLEA